MVKAFIANYDLSVTTLVLFSIGSVAFLHCNTMQDVGGPWLLCLLLSLQTLLVQTKLKTCKIIGWFLLG